jgi:hypothetical protein
MKIHKSRTMVSGVSKNEKYNSYYETFMADVLLGIKSNTKVLGVENIKKELFFYTLYQHVEGSPIAFMKLGESSIKSKVFNQEAAVTSMFKLGTAISESNGVFDLYQTYRLNTAMALLHLSSKTKNFYGEENRYYWLLHSVIHPEDRLKTHIEKNLLGMLPYERRYPMAIIHASLKEKYRVEHFKNKLMSVDKALTNYLNLTNSQ